ncbi:alpha-glucan family phosphorylase [Leptolyngbya sp. 7M]|uniref:alpha-glucan family phosphorylase n=1 Tax=Leptolyngbya sp. 7M TaxID=2812896 RepID=UPI001B8BD743|nr:alpha-glucan family phosphorylase [Leptolyngbya sp. 7M]QYO66307.1 alpha-glucan family phosphorylase [Leptolyngbya sp. 7M]
MQQAAAERMDLTFRSFSPFSRQLPSPIQDLDRISMNFYWCWQPEGAALFRDIDPELWERCEQHPRRLLAETGELRLWQIAADPGYLSRLKEFAAGFDEYINSAPKDDHTITATAERPVAYLCAEYGVHNSLPNYSGGLGILAGDHLKSASDMRLPLVAVGLLYRYGYFRQDIAHDGWQEEHYSNIFDQGLAITPVVDESGQPVRVMVHIRGREVQIQAWLAQVGRINLYLLDTNLPENSEVDRMITGHLYGGDSETRIVQEKVLGIGGVRFLRKLGVKPSVFHLNEGHAAFSTLELAQEYLAEYPDSNFAQAQKAVREQCVFTTQALAGHEVIPIAGTLDWSLTPVNCTAEAVFQLVAAAHPDLVVVGNLHNMEQPLDVLELLASHFYTVFIMHDQWLLTGRCGYVGTCEKYMVTCDAACPTSNEYPRLAPDKIKDAFERKHTLVRNCDRLLVLGDSHWTTNWARYAFFNYQPRQAVVELDHKFQTIHYGLDLKTFYPRDRQECRRQLGLPEDKFIILTGSQSIEDERKGFRFLVEALKIAALDNVMVVSFGYGASIVEGVEVHSAGYVSHPLLLACYYSAADLFVGPSQEEAFGQTFIEAAACGTPAVGYALGGIKEAITDGITGRVVIKRTPEALAAVIAELYTDERQRQLLSTLAPIYIANTFSFQSSYHSFMVALDQSGWLNLLQLNPASKFAAHLPDLTQPTVVMGENGQTLHSVISGSGVTGHALTGFSGMEPPYPQLELESPSQWLLWPEGEFVVISSKSQQGSLVINCRNISPDQHLEIWRNGQICLQEQVPCSDIKRRNVLSLTVLLEQGVNRFTLKVSDYQIDESQRKLGLLIEKIEFEVCSNS